MSFVTQEPSPESVWAILQETARRMQETDRRMKETDRQMQETDRRMKETDRQIKELSREIREAKELFTTRWGRLMESLVEGRLVELLNQRGIPVYDTTPRVKGNRHGRSYEFDIVAHNGDKIVIVEVKTTLRPDDVSEFVQKLRDAKTLMPRYRDNIIHGAMAWLQANAGADRMAINQKLFSIRAVGDSAYIINQPDFRPKAF